jgi:hypothetical protein
MPDFVRERLTGNVVRVYWLIEDLPWNMLDKQLPDAP